MTPQILQQKINEISDEYFEVCQEMASISERHGAGWLEHRATCKTDNEAKMRWEATADGKREGYLKWYIKGLSAKRSALILEHRMNQNL